MTLQYQKDLPKNQWDKCKFCGNIRKKPNGNHRGSVPTCSKQGCPGQHLSKGVPLTQEERNSL